MGALRDHIHAGMRMHGQSLLDDSVFSLESVFKEHLGIFDAIKRREPELAKELMFSTYQAFQRPVVRRATS